MEQASAVTDLGDTVLELDGLRIDLRPRPSYFDRWFDCCIEVASHPFAGTLVTIFTDEELVQFAEALAGLDPTGEAVLGGNRAAELRLAVEEQVGGERPALSVECSLTPSGDDPSPLLHYLIFDVQPFAATAAEHLRRLVATDPWPTP